MVWMKKPDVQAKLELVASLNTGEQYAIGIKKGNERLRKLVDESIEEAKGNGSYEAIYKKWFGNLLPSSTP